MPKFKHLLKTRIGTCRSGMPLDLPHELNPLIVREFFSRFNAGELVDIFCMTEALISRSKEALQAFSEFSSIQLINSHLRNLRDSPLLADEFKELKLKVSPDYVRHGLKLLLG